MVLLTNVGSRALGNKIIAAVVRVGGYTENALLRRW